MEIDLDNPDAFAASPVHVGLAGKMNIRDFHFTLQQILLMGDVGGLSRASFSLPLNILTREELEEKFRKIREARDRALKALAQMSFELGQDIIRVQNDIAESLRVIDKKMNALKSDDPGAVQMRKDRRALQEAQQNIETIDDRRIQATEPEQIENARVSLKNLVESIRHSLERHEQDIPFNFKADEARRQPAEEPVFEIQDEELKPAPNQSSSGDETVPP